MTTITTLEKLAKDVRIGEYGIDDNALTLFHIKVGPKTLLALLELLKLQNKALRDMTDKYGGVYDDWQDADKKAYEALEAFTKFNGGEG